MLSSSPPASAATFLPFCLPQMFRLAPNNSLLQFKALSHPLSAPPDSPSTACLSAYLSTSFSSAFSFLSCIDSWSRCRCNHSVSCCSLANASYRSDCKSRSLSICCCSRWFFFNFSHLLFTHSTHPTQPRHRGAQGALVFTLANATANHVVNDVVAVAFH